MRTEVYVIVVVLGIWVMMTFKKLLEVHLVLLTLKLPVITITTQLLIMVLIIGLRLLEALPRRLRSTGFRIAGSYSAATRIRRSAPVLRLKESVKAINGSGTEDDPYIISAE